MLDAIGCYVHIPFCVRKCAYCDFNSHSGYTAGHIARYVAALTQEISAPPAPNNGGAGIVGARFIAPSKKGVVNHAPTPPLLGAGGPLSVDTIFFGGGTPTAIPAGDEAALLRTVLNTLPVTPDAEITTEANPGTMDTAHLEVLTRKRVLTASRSASNRLTPACSKHWTASTPPMKANTPSRAARAAGFDNVSIDLMFALPRQTLTQWRDTLDQALALDTDHLSLYGLIVEEGTGFYTLQQKGRLPLPDDDTAAEMYQMALDMPPSSAGYDAV